MAGEPRSEATRPLLSVVVPVYNQPDDRRKRPDHPPASGGQARRAGRADRRLGRLASEQRSRKTRSSQRSSTTTATSARATRSRPARSRREGEYISYVDADLDLDPSAIPEFLAAGRARVARLRDRLEAAPGLARPLPALATRSGAGSTSSSCGSSSGSTSATRRSGSRSSAARSPRRSCRCCSSSSSRSTSSCSPSPARSASAGSASSRCSSSTASRARACGRRAVLLALVDTARDLLPAPHPRGTTSRKRELLPAYARAQDFRPRVSLVAPAEPPARVPGLDVGRARRRDARGRARPLLAEPDGEVIAFLDATRRPAANWLDRVVPFLAQPDDRRRRHAERGARAGRRCASVPPRRCRSRGSAAARTTSGSRRATCAFVQRLPGREHRRAPRVPAGAARARPASRPDLRRARGPRPLRPLHAGDGRRRSGAAALPAVPAAGRRARAVARARHPRAGPARAERQAPCRRSPSLRSSSAAGSLVWLGGRGGVAWALVWAAYFALVLVNALLAGLRFRSLRVAALAAVGSVAAHLTYAAGLRRRAGEATLKVSVVIPVYNEREQHRRDDRRAVDAALAKRGLDAEIVVVDDGSTDGSAEAARRRGERPAAPGPRAAEQRPVRSAQAGLEAADGRLRALPRQPRAPRSRARSPFVAERLDAGERRLERARRRSRRDGNPYGRFWNVLDGARVRRLLREPADDELRRRELRPLPEGNDLLPRAARALCSRRSPPSRPATATRGTRTTTRRSSAGSPSERPIHISPQFGCLVPAARLAPRLPASTRTTAESSSSTGTAAASRASSRSSSPSIPLSARLALAVASAGRRPSPVVAGARRTGGRRRRSAAKGRSQDETALVRRARARLRARARRRDVAWAHVARANRLRR